MALPRDLSKQEPEHLMQVIARPFVVAGCWFFGGGDGEDDGMETVASICINVWFLFYLFGMIFNRLCVCICFYTILSCPPPLYSGVLESGEKFK